MWQKVKTWFRRLHYFTMRDILTLNNIVLVIAAILCFSWTWGAISSMSRNWALEEKLKTRRLEAAKLELEVQTLKLEQQYYQTEEYQELMARSKLGKKAEGETVVILPENSEDAKTKYIQQDIERNEYRNNFSEWLDFLFS